MKSKTPCFPGLQPVMNVGQAGLVTGGTGVAPPAAGTSATPIPAAGTSGGGGTGVLAGTGAVPVAGAANSGLVKQDDAASGCACRTVPQRGNEMPAALALFVVAAFTRLRRRRG